MGKEQLMQNRLGVLSLLYSAVKGIFSFRGMVPFTLILLVITSLGAVIQSIDEKTPMPFFKSFGGKVLNYEQRLAINSQEIVENKGIIVGEKGIMTKINFTWEVIKNISNILFALWVLYFIFYLIYKILRFFGGEALSGMSLVVLTIIMVVFIEIISNFVILEEENKIEQPTFEKIFPLKGFRELWTAFPYFFTPVYNVAEEISNKELINISKEVANGSIY